MTTTAFTRAMVEIVADLSRPLTASQRYQRLLQAFKSTFPCDATGLLQLQGQGLTPLAVEGLSDDTLGRCFDVTQHPRLAKILHSREPVRFATDCDLPDPYDGLVEDAPGTLPVHDCMGAALYIDEQPWGVITLDAMEPGTFDRIDPLELRAFIHVAEASVKVAGQIEQLESRIQQEHQITRAVLSDQQQSMVGNSASLRQLQQEIETVAQSDLSVLVCGETGVGKELVARQIHHLSARNEAPLIYVNCAALPENLVESEMFGHVKGAFSGAHQARAGKFELADGGTLFLDEVGEIPLVLQAKLLRALQSGEIQRVGSDRYLQVDVRIVAATNRDLQQEVSAGRFRADLYHRLSVYPIDVPPLRQRGKDVLLLAGHFMEANRRRLGLQSVRLDQAAKKALQAYGWPGNIRELEHSINRALLKARRDNHGRITTIGCQHLDITPAETAPIVILQDSERDNPSTVEVDLKSATDDFQRRIINQTLERHDGNQAQAARALGVDRSNFYRLLKRLGLRD
ncbi:nitric oxide reductase transcriptional regulator NorR [Pseudomaricurvus alkylphenolicus]|jgi:anaerobic nitric oxide reductase transcription regulator|uniref:nitric oxide reductase transcriptional regulator NorR n=1 Tax=Pseudomaricurvus alkylphenolicus TaxID=1306991 RepID=UPI0014240BB6|nr:nitric oxide reductase transcriptional regulator NorR [Pseudomaricurvus alkylphenolicus]NIB39201.1 nitric oxide reductase transcriptional regulator NorR [Pseudomaricurvus alkylphenolicus]